MEQRNSGKETILTAVFTVLIFVGVHVLRIPWPLSEEKEFIHLGYVVTALALMNVDMVKGWLAALIAFILSSVLDRDFGAIIGILVYLTISSLATASVYGFWMDRDELTTKAVRKIQAKTILMYGALVFLSNRAWTSWSLMNSGTKVAAAAAKSILSAGPILVNAGITILFTAILVVPVSALCKRILK